MCLPRIEPAARNRSDLTAGNGAQNDQWFRPRRNRIGKRSIRRLMGQILLASEEPQERPALPVTWSRIVPRSIG